MLDGFDIRGLVFPGSTLQRLCDWNASLEIEVRDRMFSLLVRSGVGRTQRSGREEPVVGLCLWWNRGVWVDRERMVRRSNRKTLWKAWCHGLGAGEKYAQGNPLEREMGRAESIAVARYC